MVLTVDTRNDGVDTKSFTGIALEQGKTVDVVVHSKSLNGVEVRRWAFLISQVVVHDMDDG